MTRAARTPFSLATVEQGSSIIETLLALGLVAMVVVAGIQLLLFEQTRVIAVAAAQAGAQGAAQGGEDAGLAAAAAVIAAGGGLGSDLHVTVSQEPGSVTAAVTGRAEPLFATALQLPMIAAAVTASAEAYPPAEAKP